MVRLAPRSLASLLLSLLAVSGFAALTPGEVFNLDGTDANVGNIVGISTGFDSEVVVDADGHVQSFLNYNIISNQPAGLSDVQAVAAGSGFALALLNNGTVVGWGALGQSGKAVPAGLTGVVAISAGFNTGLALKGDGTVVSWGFNYQNTNTPPVGLTGVVSIAAGLGFNVVAKSDGTLVGWGHNSIIGQAVPDGVDHVVAVSTTIRKNQFAALRSDGTVVAWGDQYKGATVIPGISDAVAIAVQNGGGVALRANGTLAGWGVSLFGVISNYTLPASLNHIEAITADLALKGAGGTTTPSSAPSGLQARVRELHNRSASLDITVTPNGLATTATVSFGTTDQYGLGGAVGDSFGAGRQPASATYALSNLQPHTVYHYRVVAQNSAGSTGTDDATFTTPDSVPVAVADIIFAPDFSAGQTLHVLANDSDADGDGLTITSVTAPKHGTATISGGSTIVYKSAASFKDTDQFVYTITDGSGGSAHATVTVSDDLYIPQAGLFQAVVRLSDLVSLQLSKTGSFTGKVVIEGKTAAVQGKLDVNGAFSGLVGTTPLTLQSNLTTTPASLGQYALTGSLGGAAFTAYHTVYPASGPAAPEAGTYTLLLAATSSNGSAPPAAGYARLSVSKHGAVNVKGTLADGSPFGASGPLTGSADGTPQYDLFTAVLDGNRGRLAGALSFQATGVSAAAGTVGWVRGPVAGKAYPGGFSTNLAATAARYAAPPAHTTALPLLVGPPNNARITLNAGTPGFPLTELLSISASNVVTVPGENLHHVALRFNAANGTFSGSFVDPGSVAKIPFSGGVFQNATAAHASGFFREGLASGSVEIVPH